MPIIKPNPPILQPNHPLNRGLVGAWLFTEGAGIRANDASLRGRSSTFVGGPTWAGGRAGVAYHNNLAIAYADLGDNILSMPFSVSAWVKIDALGSVGHVIWSQADAASTTDRHALCVDSTNSFKFSALSTSTGATSFNNSALSVAAAAAGFWYHLVGVWVSITSRTLYVNGVFQSTNTASVVPSAQTRARIGQFADSTPNWEINGSIDEVRLFNRALTPSEAQALSQSDHSEFRRQRMPVIWAGASARPMMPWLPQYRH